MRTVLFTVAALLAGASPAQAAVTLSSGHADYGARIVGGRLQAQVKDSTRGRTVWRDPSDVVIALGASARHTLPGGSFLGRKGARVWMIPQTQRSNVIWLGWNTEELSSRQVRSNLTWTLDRVDGPGRVAVFQTGSFGKADVLFDSHRSRPGSRAIRLGVHAHGNWAFTRAGTYRLRFTSTATARSGRRLSDTATLTVRVS
ncbi:TIGR03773 family transporter-associated surface protein [Solirubrobacter sp. CPCC 204708]|uniref:TIGR03773 family transporter-associated surface protein n=1 Tax=Solirubrobacter deserti TaxID=2282478 RepID=A0ABT4RCK5_9ACTN|nr:TIGR03773 family transporter-associated surface protein [Solirubrobacter deserti]MBE2315637.1 TIGR03773 family transporter-associated surface protein [Solirubrobacter deserti]MDA0136275.1 TIGR03773 family transporter-associated surface protein [Solirubrobacter deserti]